MKIMFDVGGSTAQFRRNLLTAGVHVIIDGDDQLLLNPWRLETQFSISNVRRWSIPHAGHMIEIQLVRPWVLAGLRRRSCTIWVDGQLAAQARQW
jgi:hypothetical protein